MDIGDPFGGKVMLFGGDFRQVLPVVPKSTRAEIVNASLVKSYLWPLMEKIQFTRNMRARTDPTFSDFLLRVGNGDEPTIRENLILLPEQLTIKHSKDEILEEYLLALLVQAEKPKPLLEMTESMLSSFLPQERAYQKILAQLLKKAETLETHAFAKSLPTELVQTYDTCLLLPLTQFSDEKKLLEEVENTAQKLKKIYIQQNMKKLAGEIDAVEQDDEGKAEELKRTYSELAKQLDVKESS